MSHLLDTNVISEHSRSRPNPRALAWLRTLPVEEQYLSGRWR
jgi:predicted nucleic acid-binding protein